MHFPGDEEGLDIGAVNASVLVKVRGTRLTGFDGEGRGVGRCAATPVDDRHRVVALIGIAGVYVACRLIDQLSGCG